VVDKETDEFFKKCKVIPSQEHLDGEFTVKPGVWPEPTAWPEMGDSFPIVLSPSQQPWVGRQE
jgi:hypothetical protein